MRWAIPRSSPLDLRYTYSADRNQEARESRIDLRDVDPDAVNAVLYFYYHDTLDEAKLRPDGLAPLLFYARVLMAADEYQIDSLRIKAKDKLSTYLTTAWKDDSFADLIQEVYATFEDKDGSNDHDLLHLVRWTATSHHKELFNRNSRYAYFREVARSTPGLTADVLTYVVDGPPRVDSPGMLSVSAGSAAPTHPPQRRYQCPRCQCWFTASMRPDDIYTHQCLNWPARRATIANTIRGSEWLANVVHNASPS